MGLLTDKVENAADTDTATSAPAAAPTPQVSAAEMAARAVAAHNASQSGGAVATAKTKANLRVLDDLKDKMVVEYDTLAGLKLNQGRFFDQETETSMGESIELRVLSWQESWMVAPGDMKADKNLIKYADNALTANDGTDLNDHLKKLVAMGYSKAKKMHRCVLVGALAKAEKPHPLIGQLVQIDLAPKSKTAWDRYRANASWNLSQGAWDEDGVQTVKITAVIAPGPDDTSYTKASFDKAPAAA